MVQTITSHDYPDLGTFEGHSVLTGRLITMGRVVLCSKGYLPQVKSSNKWINVSSSLPSLKAARNFLFDRHYQEAKVKRGWTDEQLQNEILTVQESNIQTWSEILQKRMDLQRQVQANLIYVHQEALEIFSDPATKNLSAKALTSIVTQLGNRVYFQNKETTKNGAFRSLKLLIEYCKDLDLQREHLNKLANLG